MALLGCLVCNPAASMQPVSDLPLESLGNERWLLPAGQYQGNFVIEQPMQLHCEEGARFDAGGKGHGLLIRAAKVRVEGCSFANWGRSLTEMNSGVFVSAASHQASLLNNHLEGPGFGIWVDGASDILIQGNDITGDAALRSQDRGNGIHLYAVTGARVIDNRVRLTRDGIYIDTSNRNHLQGNVLEELRYGIHYMFSNDNRVIGNLTRGTRTGYALMQSRKLEVLNNRSVEDQNYGILMNYITYSTISGNQVVAVKSGSTGDSMISGAEGKALFIYNSVFNRIENNLFAHSALGIHLTAGSEDNQITGNAFVNNQHQVKYVATRTQEWSDASRGNYWSDYLGWDRNSDGLGDIPYEPNDNVDRLLWLYPQMRLLLHSPAIELLRWVQQAFPVVKFPGVRDSYPLMEKPVWPERASVYETD
ncbi:nitrous oxide reductase family maturation protein NosD [Bowmanella dokdonensis]|uniref:Nitrous oxide reductase family maturation protein NosD n=2 Tax=Bowmanella dokdonensis TaxID=751969 RepID=A0A939IQD0_9ALTE|nr:nitrous oxide reductase family maturation protein NosD [Bowmanella dokdonensis]